MPAHDLTSRLAREPLLYRLRETAVTTTAEGSLSTDSIPGREHTLLDGESIESTFTDDKKSMEHAADD